MKRIHIVRDYLEYARAHNRFEETLCLDLKEQMRTNAIHDNGIAETFSFSENCYDLILDYIQIEDTDTELYPDMFEKQTGVKQISLHCPINPDPGYKDILGSCLMYHETGEIDDKLKHKFEEIKEEFVKKYNAVYSSVNMGIIDIDEIHEIISIHYSYYYIKDEFIDKINSDDVIFGKVPLPYDEWFNSDSHSTDDSSRKVGIALTKDVETALNKGYIDCTPPDFTTERCYSEKALKEAKENSNMRIHILIVPAGMNEEFVNNTKKTLQTNDDTVMCVSSNDIEFEPSDKYKTKYDLLEYWIKSGMIYIVEFMVGYEGDPEAKAFEAFIRGIKTNSTMIGATNNVVHLRYQKDIIEDVIDNLRGDYDESSEARNKLDKITDHIMDKVKFFKKYGLEDNDLDVIRNADCDRKDAYNATVDKITEIAFASDKKGSKGNKK